MTEDIRSRFKRKGSDLGQLFGDLVTLQEGDRVSFQGRVILEDENGRQGSFEGNLSLLLNRYHGHKDYILTEDNSSLTPGTQRFSHPLVGVGYWSMKDYGHIVKTREDLGPFLYAETQRGGKIVIESIK